MNISMLPKQVREEVQRIHNPESVKEGVLPDIVRSTSYLDGTNGESYIIGYPGVLYIFGRHIGESDYISHTLRYGTGLKKIEISEENYKVIFKVYAGVDLFQFRCSSFDKDDLLRINEIVTIDAAERGGPVLSGGDTDEDSEASCFSSKLEVLAVVLMYVATIDEEIDEREDHYITQLFLSNPGILKTALKYYKSHTFEQFLKDCGSLSEEQCLCMLTHMMELAFADDVMHTSEQDIIHSFCSFFDIQNEAYETVKQVIFIKNNLSVFH